MEAAVRCARDAAVERVVDIGVEGGTGVDEGFLGVQDESNFFPFLFQEVKRTLERRAVASERDVIQVGSIEEEIREVIAEAEEEGMKDE